MPITPDQIFKEAFKKGASDVHVAANVPIMFRIDKELVAITEKPLKGADVDKLVKHVLGDQYERFTKEREIDVSYAVGDNLRLRVNCHYERGYPSFVARVIPSDIPTIEETELEEIGPRFVNLHEGLILFTGPTGSGKSTSMAALLDEIRKNRSVNILTLEDPVEYLFPPVEGSIIRQRQFGEDFLSFGEALRRVLRQDPDVVMVGEMRDLETIAAALTLAETGHLVLATLHTPNTTQTIDRIVDVFAPHQQPQIRNQLSLSLQAIVAQRLIPKAEGGLTALREILVNTPAVSNIIRENRIQELVSTIQMGGQEGMMTFEAHAKTLLKAGTITQDTFNFVMEIVDV